MAITNILFTFFVTFLTLFFIIQALFRYARGTTFPSEIGRWLVSRFRNYQCPTDRSPQPRTVPRESVTWYPGHMARGTKEMLRRLGDIQCIVEVRDARIPLTSRSEQLSDYREVRPHILLLNKADLTDLTPVDRKKLRAFLAENEGINHVFFISLKQPERQRKALFAIVDLLTKILSPESLLGALEEEEQLLMVCGLPNVGKSTFINALRNLLAGRKSGARVGKKAGITRGVGERVIISPSNPRLSVLDTPGVLEPARKRDITSLFRFGVCSCIDFDAVDIEVFVDYALYFWNRHNMFNYVKFFNLPAPTDNVFTFLSHVARNRGLEIKTSSRVFDDDALSMSPNLHSASRVVIKHLVDGDLGKVFYDWDLLEGQVASKRKIPFVFL